MNLPLNQSVELTSEERMLALFSHLSIFVGGIVLPIIFWALNKDKSRFVRFHSLQAIFFQVAYIVLLVAVVVVMVVIGVGLGIISAGTFASGKNGSIFLFVAIFAFYAIFFLVMFAFIAYAIYIGVKSYKGELRRYPVIGNIIYGKVYGKLNTE